MSARGPILARPMLRGLIFLILFPPLTLLFGIPATLLALVGVKRATMWLGKPWSRCCLWLVGARVRILDAERLTLAQPCIYLANHQSAVDIWAMLIALPSSTRFVAKQSLFRIPGLGWAMRASGFIAIDRTNRSAAVKSLRVAAERIRDGSPVVLYPEGTRSKDGILQPFKKGPFHLAVQARVPLVPMLLVGTHRVMPPGSLHFRPGRVEVRVLPPVEMHEGEKAEALRDRMEAIFREGLADTEHVRRD